MNSRIQEYCNNHGWQYTSANKRPKLPSDSQAVVLLLPPWSKKDFMILDDIAGVIKRNKIKTLAYDIDEIKTQEKMQHLFPKSQTVIQTPVAIHYLRGEINRLMQGAEIADLVSIIEGKFNK